ncbi:alpha/beta fold hydrolase [Runella zeae]|uniref:alpha/beta fold hydrolase n=1 Tax=Runella zeae TaxID=94255 RepID=UPI00235789C4|nr:alpha/beta fold hydrolase [Runella zeae]
MKKIGCFLLMLLSAIAYAQLPERKAVMGMRGKDTADGILVDTVFANGTLATVGIQKGDLIVSLNNQSVTTMLEFNAIASNIRAGESVSVMFSRGRKRNAATTTAVARALEQSDIAEVKYDWVKFRNGYLRAITRIPKGKTIVPAILLIPGYGCGSIENYASSYNGKLMDEWLKNGYAVVTIEKSGVGDSYGCVPCAEVDLVTDIESFDAGYRYMEQLPFVDKTQLFIWGHSMGGTIAPEIAKRHQPKGVMVFGCVFRPWSEFLLEMHRVQKPLLDGLNYQQTETFVRTIQKVYYEFFVLKKSPAELYQNPEYKAVVASELGYKENRNNNMWGRHWRFWQQLDSLNLAQSWQKVNCPVLVIHGGADYEQCSLVEPYMIQQAVNEAHPNYATWVTIPDLDHFMMKSKDWPEAVKNFREQQYLKGNFHPQIADETIKWLKKYLQ